MNERQLALTIALALAAAPALADGAHERGGGSSSSSSGAIDRHPGSSGGSSMPSFSPPSSESGPASSSASSSSSSGSHERSGTTARHSDSRRGSDHGDRGRRSGGYSHRWTYGPRSYGWGWYPYGGYYDNYYWGYYGWGASYSPYRYAYSGDFGSLRIMVEPDDAEVYVDGYYAGEVDDFNGVFQRLHVRPGRHEIALKRHGYRTHRVRVYVPVGGTLKIHYDMERGQPTDVTESVVGSPEDVGRLDRAHPEPTDDQEPAEPAPPVENRRPADVKLDVKPVDAAVYVDGRFMGNGDDVDELQLAPGKHRVEVVRPGYATFEKDVEVKAGEGRNIKIELEKAAKAQ
jgi:hypothetical protein